MYSFWRRDLGSSQQHPLQCIARKQKEEFEAIEVIKERDYNKLDHYDALGGREHWFDSRYILKVESPMSSERLNAECEKKSTVKNNSKAFKLCNCEEKNIH